MGTTHGLIYSDLYSKRKETIMTGLITKSRGLILAGALGLSVLALAACGGGDSTNAADNTNGQGTASGLANLLNSTSGAAAYEQLLRGTGGSGSNTGT